MVAERERVAFVVVETIHRGRRPLAGRYCCLVMRCSIRKLYVFACSPLNLRLSVGVIYWYGRPHSAMLQETAAVVADIGNR